MNVSEIMSSNFRWVEPETEIEDAIQKMLNNNIRRLIILDDNKLAGVVTQTDLTGFLRDKLLFDKTIKNIQKNYSVLDSITTLLTSGLKILNS